MLTYGEAHTKRKLSMRMVNGEFIFDDMENHLQRMSENDALNYYIKKFNLYFGIEVKESINYFTKENIKIFIKKVRYETDLMLMREVTYINKQLKSA